MAISAAIKTKNFTVFLFSLSSLCMLFASTFAAVHICKEWYGILIGIVMMIFAIPFHCHGKEAKWGYAVSFLLNSAANGFSLSALYISNDIKLDAVKMLFALVPSFAVMLFAYLMLQIFKAPKKAAIALSIILNAILLIVFMILWITKGGILYSFGFFALILSILNICVFGMVSGHERRSALRFVSFGSYGAYIIITLVAVLVLTEGDMLDGLDGFIDIGSTKTKKNKPNRKSSL